MTGELGRLAAGVVFAGFRGAEPPGWLLRWVERGLGGVVLFAENVIEPARLSALQQPGLVVAIDEEGGDVTRLEASRGSSYPGNLALGAVDDVELTRDVAAAIAADLARAGITMNLAPVADVNTNPDNPVIGVRSFGSDPGLVARHVAAFVEGTQRQGVAACAKHFPGHGDTATDSHLELPVVEGDVSAALVPFRAAVGAGVRAVMTAHLVVPALDEAPATLSRTIVTELLRAELGFDGVVVTDALEMRAISATVGVEDGAVRALAAGADALCLGADVDERYVERVHGAVVDAVRSGLLAEERLTAAADRVARLARWAAPSAGDAPDRAIGAAAARRAVRPYGDVRVGASPLVVELVPEPSIAAGRAAHGLGDLLGTPVVRLAKGEAVPEVEAARPLILVLRDAGRHAWQQAALRELVGRRPDAVVVETGVPGPLPDGAGRRIVTYGGGRANLAAAAELLTG